MKLARLQSSARALPSTLRFSMSFSSVRSAAISRRGLSTAHAPAVGRDRRFADAGCLMSDAEDLNEMHRRAATYVDRILRGAKPAELPVEQPTKFELVINMKTAKALGLTIPPLLLARADEIIQ